MMLVQKFCTNASALFLFQESFIVDEHRSQMDVLLSQDSTYQGDRLYPASQLSQGLFN